MSHRQDYVLAAMLLLYAMPSGLALLLMIRPLMEGVKRYREGGIDAIKHSLASWRMQIERSVPTEEQKAHRKSSNNRWAERAFLLFGTPFILPPTSLRVALGARLGARVALWPDFVEVWFVLFAVLPYFVAAEHHGFALMISAYVFSLKVLQVLFSFRRPSYDLGPFDQEHQPRLWDIPEAAFVLAMALGCIHYSLSLLDPNAYSRPLTAVDGFYFSVITFTTVGYGDIVPCTTLAKMVCVGEVVTGILVLGYGVNFSMQQFSAKQ